MSAVSAAHERGRAAAAVLERWLLGPADPRAYAAVRIGYAVTALVVLVDLWPLREHLLATDLPPASDPLYPGDTPLNVFQWAYTPGAVTSVFVIAALAAVLLALGVASRSSALAVYLWAVSYSTVAVVALGGFDTVLRVAGFVLVVSPQPGVWRLGSNEAQPSSVTVPAYGLRMLQWQVMLIYVSTVWLKAPDHFWRSGEVLAYFWMSMFSRFPDPAFASVGALGGLLTYATIVVEAVVPLLLWRKETRWFGVFLGLGLHLGIALTSKLAPFSIAMLALYPAFFEADDFDRVEQWLRRPRAPSAID